MTLRFRSFLIPALAAAFFALSQGVPAQQLSPQQQSTAHIEKLVGSKQYSAALTQLDAHLKTYPRDAQMRFLRGRILMETGQRQKAIEAFTALTEDFPELPEPYNNLAVLYALDGEYGKARAALEMAVRANPNFAVAYANLGDVYAKLAAQAYTKSLKLAPNAKVSEKVAQIDRLFSAPAPAPVQAPAPASAGSAKPAYP